MDEFAQSRGDDDLFSDDFEPATTPTIVEESSSQGQFPGGQVEAVQHPAENEGGGGKPRHNQNHRGDRREDRGRGRGRANHRGRGGAGQHRGEGRGGQGGQSYESNGLAASRFAPRASAPANADSRSPQVAADISTSDVVPESNVSPTVQTPLDPTASSFSAPDIPSIDPTESTETAQAADASTSASSTQPPPTQPSSQPTIPQQPRTTAVRGDRSATGGPPVTKLTEAQLTEKMAKMAILNAQKAEKFRLSEADSAAFLQQEAEMAKKRVEEQKNARAMDMERAKNRERKLKAQGGREWDSEKQESDLVDRTKARTSEYVRGNHGGVIRGGLAGSRYATADGTNESESGSNGRQRDYEPRGRGRGGRGRGGGRGGKTATPTVPTAEDFPSLPGAATKAKEDNIKSPAADVGDWAEEMATTPTGAEN